MLNRLNFAVLRATEREGPRFAPPALRITKRATVATNRYWLAMIERPQPGEDCGCVARADAANLEKTMRKQRTQKVKLIAAPNGGFLASPLDVPLAARTEFPDYEPLLRAVRKRKTKAEVWLSARFLRDIADMLLAAPVPLHRPGTRVRIRITGRDQPVEFHACSAGNQKMFALLMPIVGDDNPFDASAMEPPARQPRGEK
jgi:hypothetical protein